MEEFALLEERKISGKGVLKPPIDIKTARMFVLYADVVRPPKSAYQNYHYNPPRSRYAFFVFLRNGYAIETGAMEFERQSYDGVEDIAGQTLLALKCANATALKNISALSTALNVSPVFEGNIIKDYTNLNLSWDEVRVVCYADTAINLKLYGLKYDVCNSDYNKSSSPPFPPPPPPRVPPGTPINDLSPKYEEDNNDNYSPYPGDKPKDPIPPPPPEPLPCDKVRVTLLGTYSDGRTRTIVGVNGNGLQYAPIVRAFVGDGGASLKVQGGGQVGTVGCNGTDGYEINYILDFNPNNTFVSVQIVSKEVVP